MEKRKWESLDYILSKFWLKFIAVYYVALILIGVIISVVILANIKGFVADNIVLYTSGVSIAVSCMLCSIQYLKRLYKACLDDRTKVSQAGDKLKQFGNVLYFMLRPLYAAVFVLIGEFALLSGVIIVTSENLQINERFLYLCVVMSSIVGFSIGRILDAFEVISAKRVDSILKDKEDN